MSEQKGIPGWKAPNPEDLPEEERELFEEQLKDPRSEEDKAIIDGEIAQQTVEPQQQQPQDTDTNFLSLGTKVYRHFAQFDTYNIQMRDGSVVKYTGLFPAELEYEELEDIRAQIVDKTDMDGKPFTAVQLRHMEKLWLDKLGEYYLLNTKTKQPMTRAERLQCKEQWIIHGILKSKLLRSNYDNGPIGKN